MELVVLRRGMENEMVGHWQSFLRGLGLYLAKVDNDFGGLTFTATKDFQRKYKLKPIDGVVGTGTYGKAMMLGFDIGLVDIEDGKNSIHYPPKPNFSPLVTQKQREDLFGKFEYKVTPTATNPEKITLIGNWRAENIVKVNLPALSKATGGKYTSMYWHKDVEHQLAEFFDQLEQEKLHTRILSYAGAFYPRFVRGSRKHLSNHSWGTAFDINVPYNGLNRQPALVGQKGCVRELVEIANEHGFYWGGHFTRPDGMHFEIAKIL